MLTSTFTLWSEAVSDLFVMRSCLACQTALVRQERFVCIDCLEGLDHTDFHLHPQDNEMYKRIAGKSPLDAAYSMAWFDKGGAIQHILQSLKYSKQPEIGTWLGALFGKKLASSDTIFPPDTCLVPVPLHWRKQRKRGYNQAEKICEGLSQSLEIPIKSDLIRRVKYTKTQTRMSGQRRYTNVSQAFECRHAIDRPVLLVDDVMTTGATLESCINTIANATPGQSNISILSIGIARS